MSVNNKDQHIYQVENWTPEESREAQALGWNVFSVWEEGRIDMVIQAEEHIPTFATDEEARQHVAKSAEAGNALCQRAIKAVFISGCQPRTPRKKK